MQVSLTCTLANTPPLTFHQIQQKPKLGYPTRRAIRRVDLSHDGLIVHWIVYIKKECHIKRRTSMRGGEKEMSKECGIREEKRSSRIVAVIVGQ